MGILKGSVSLTRYAVEGELRPGFWDFADRRIRQFAFKDIEDSAEESATGWVGAGDIFDTSFAYMAYALEPYLALGLRLDRRQVPGPLVKKYHRLEIRQALRVREGRPLSRMEREELKERARLRLLERIPPTSRSFEVVWNTATGAVWLGAAGKSVCEVFEDLFTRTFEMDLAPVLPWGLAARALDEGSLDRLEGSAPITLYEKEL